METTTETLHIMDGINFDCSGCGNCCFEWPVPLTKLDFQKLSKYADEEKIDRHSLFRVLATNQEDEKLMVFTHSLEKRDDGRCEFLTADKRCRLHIERDAASKPSMCQLFPYTFTSTPSGVFASVSFASTGVILNSGRPLSEQSELLAQRHELFRTLFPGLTLDWSGVQVVDGLPITWPEYIEKEKPIISRLASCAGSSRVERILFEETEAFRKMVANSSKLDNLAGLTVRPKTIDQVLLAGLLYLYFPEQVFSMSVCDLDARGLMKTVLDQPERVPINYKNKNYSIDELNRFRLGRLSEAQEDILRRFLLCRVFSKLYFGPGFNYMSIIAGMHHLCLLVALVRIRLKLALLDAELESEQAAEFLFSNLVEEVRLLERRLTVANFSGETTAMLEVLLASPQRIDRIISLAS
jgi:Predicted Fe-S-cluster oxidoreductase